MTSISNITNQTTVQPNQPQKPAEQVSIFNTPQPKSNGSVEETKSKTPKTESLLQKLCAEFAKYNLSIEQLKQMNILSKISGRSPEQLENASEEELNRIYESLKTAIRDSIKDGNIDLNNVIKLGRVYNTALFGGWSSIDALKKSNKSSSEDISARMERFFGLKKGSFANLPKNKIEEYFERYFNQYFLDRVKHSKNPKETYRLQLQDFTKLLINTPDSQKGIFKQAIQSLAASNKLKGLDAVFMSFESEEARTELAISCDSEFIEEALTKPDIEGNVPSVEDGTAFVALLTAKKDAEHIEKDFKATDVKAKNFFEENKTKLETIQEKLDKGEPLSEEEKKLLIMKDYFTSVKAGEMSGTALNQIIEESVKECLLTEMNKSAYELPNYEEILEQLTEYINNNPNQYPFSKDELIKLLDKVTNGNFTEFVNHGSNGNFNPPATEDNGNNTNAELGFSQTNINYEESQKNIEEIKNRHKEETNQITIEKTPTPTESKSKINPGSIIYLSATEIANGIKVGLFTYKEAMEAISDAYYKASSSAKDLLAAYVKQMTDGAKTGFLDKLGGSALIDIILKTNIDPEKFKLKTNYYTKKAIERIEEQKEKEIS